jgi:membrane associated rhomboid family serine protease
MDVMTSHYAEQPPKRRNGQPPGSGHSPDDGGAPSEPVFNAPWQAILVVVLIVGGYGLQTLFPADAVLRAFAFAPANLAPGRWETVITALFLHGGWDHALMNGAFALAFAAPVARLFGPSVEGFLIFFSFYLVCGVLANLGYAAVHPGSPALIVGASGAVSGLMGAASRLMGADGRVGPLLSRNVIGMAGGWIVINLLFAVIGGGFLPGAGNAGVAWEAHLAGFAVGVLLIGPLSRLAPVRS